MNNVSEENIILTTLENQKAIEKFPLVAVTSMLLAAKYNEIYHPDLNDIVFASYFIVTNSVVMESSDSAKSIITKKSIKETEKKIYTILRCNIGVPLDIDYM